MGEFLRKSQSGYSIIDRRFIAGDMDENRSPIGTEETIRYFEGQPEHHRRKTFQEEYIEFLRRHGIDYDERYVWG